MCFEVGSTGPRRLWILYELRLKNQGALISDLLAGDGFRPFGSVGGELSLQKYLLTL